MSKQADKPRCNEALIAAALQDHMLRSLGLNSAPVLRPIGKPKSNHVVPPLPSGKKTGSLSANPLAKGSKTASGSDQTGVNKLNQSVSRSANVTSQVQTGSQAKSTPAKEPSVQTIKSTKAAAPKEKEYNLDPRPPPLTLAQRFGLVEKPKERLSDADWQKLKDQSNNRADSSQPCVVCKEDFALQPQVLLSCSHVFHRACLEAFERFSGKRTCPLCRREEYEKRVIFEGARNYRHVAATKIQATWRAYRVRKAYRAFRAAHPPNDPNLRRKFYESKLTELTEQLIRNCEEGERKTDKLVAEVDANMANFKRVMQLLDKDKKDSTDLHENRIDWTSVEQRAVTRNEEQCPICLTKMAVQSWFDLPTNNANSKQVVAKPQPQPQPQQKQPVKGTKAGNSGMKQSAINVKARSKPLALLSCSHVFHRDCIDMFEELTVMDTLHNADRTHIRQCPVCRSPYCRQVYREMTLQRPKDV